MINIENLIRDLSRVREQSPLVHNITNYVVMNNTANALLAIGASPVMAHSTEEVEDMVHIASSLVINIGTLDTPWVDAMLLAGKAANKKQIPLVFDPVGAGATSYRSQVCHKLIKECKPSIIRGNASEIIALLDGAVKTKGVDSTDPSVAALNSAKELAKQTGAIVVISGETDYITNGKEVELVKNGHPMMAKVTGMGCTATAITAAFATINSNLLEAATHAMSVMGIAGEVAAKISAGNGSLQLNFLDTLFNLNEEIIRKNIRQ